MEFDDDYELSDIVEAEHEAKPRDSKVDEAKGVLLSDVFHPSSDAVLYGQQIETLYEEKYFHWITARALNELAKEGKVRSTLLPLGTGTTIRFYAASKNRYFTRAANKKIKLVQEFADPAFTEALGRQGEIMFQAALPSVGFIPTASKVRSYKGAAWTATQHDLDFVFERDGVAYGAEIKNTLPYIPGKELAIKTLMCRHLGLRPLFIVRFAPKSYIEEVRQVGGFTLVFKYQLYPFGYRSLAKRVQAELGLPVDCPRAIHDGTARRFLNWHLKTLPRPGQ
jgi:hypothetical protein